MMKILFTVYYYLLRMMTTNNNMTADGQWYSQKKKKKKSTSVTISVPDKWRKSDNLMLSTGALCSPDRVTDSCGLFDSDIRTYITEINTLNSKPIFSYLDYKCIP